MNIVAEEVDKISQNMDVPADWLITDLDPKILDLECPKSLVDVTEDQVSVDNYFIDVKKYIILRQKLHNLHF